MNLATWKQVLTTVTDESRRAEKSLVASPPPESNRVSLPAAGAVESNLAKLATQASGDCIRHWVELLRQLAEAAQALHDAGVVHRDIKPGNVMLTANGADAVLMDLGLAQLSDDTHGRLTRTRQFVGTLRYASPEQVLAAGPIDARSDVYSLGATLWELFTLRPMFNATDEMPTPQLMQRIQFDDPEPVRRFNRAVPTDLEAIVLKCLEKDPRERYPSARELAADLERWLEGKPVIAQGRTTTYVLRKFLARHRLGVGIAAMATLLVALCYVGLCDAGVGLPGSESLRQRFDRWGISLFRPIQGDQKIRAAADRMQRDFYQALWSAPVQGGWFSKSLAPQNATSNTTGDVWSHSQAIAALLKSPNRDPANNAALRQRLILPFDPRFMVKDRDGKDIGWAVRPPKESYAAAEPALWTAAALAIGLGQPEFLTGDDRKRAEQWFAQTTDLLKQYQPLPTGGWNMYPAQTDPTQHNDYVTALGLMALLEARRANLPWEGSIERRDELLHASVKWLIGSYDATDDPAGWRASAADNSQPLDGLTLQIYALLLRAEAEAGVKLPAVILQNIPQHLLRCADRGVDYPDSVGKFVIDFTDPDGKRVVGSEPINFLWYPWAIDCAARWLERPEDHHPADGAAASLPEERVRIRRTLGHLIIDLGPPRASKAATGWTFIVSETLYGLSDTIPVNAAH